MAGLRFRTFALAAVLALGTAQWANASPIDLLVGDDDGFGFGLARVSHNGPLEDLYEPNNSLEATLSDRRSVAERIATNGAQQTDLYSALANYALRPLPETFDVVFPFVGELTSAVFSLDMGGFEASFLEDGSPGYGQLSVSFNGVSQPNLFNFSDGARATVVRSFTLGATALANATLAQQFVVTIARDLSIDGVAFDYFRLTGNVEPLPADIPAPEPMTLVMLGTGLTALAMRRRRKA